MTSLPIGQRRINRFITESGEPGSGHSLILITNVSKKTLCLEPRAGERGVNPTVARPNTSEMEFNFWRKQYNQAITLWRWYGNENVEIIAVGKRFIRTLS